MRNVDDRDVENFLALLTFLPMDEVEHLSALEGAEIFIRIRKNDVKAKVVKTPFYKK